MATPLSPNVIGPLSEWTTTIRVEGCVPNAQVTIMSLSRPAPGIVAKGATPGGVARIPLVAGVRLTQHDRLVAVQSAGGADSTAPSDDLAVPVAPAPTVSASMPNPAFVSHLWEFGRALEVQGALPGADVTISSPTALLGRGIAHEGLARINLSGVLPTSGTKVVAEEKAPAGFAFTASPPLKTTGTVNGLPVPEGASLPKPTNPQQPAPAGCDPAVYIGGVFDGASVTVTSSRDGIPATIDFDLDQLWLVLGRPLDAAGEKLEITQDMPRSSRVRSQALVIKVDPAPTPEPPVFVPPCPGSEWIGVSNLLRGADLTVQINADQYDGGQVAPDSITANLRVPPVPPRATITITQQRCGLSASATATAADLAALDGLDLGDTPIECAYKVRAVSATPGALIEIRAQHVGSASAPVRTISRQMVADASVMHMTVAPALNTQDEIWVAELVCTAPWVEGPRHRVEPIPPLASPALLFPPVIGEKSVRVSAVPGAVVEVFLGLDGGPRALLGTGPVDSDDDRVPIYRPFVQGDQVVLVQRFCSHFSALGEPSLAAVPGVMVFEQPAGQVLSFPSQGGHEVKCAATGGPAVTMTCRVDGTWTCTALVTNTQPGGICTFTLSFVADDSQGVIFSKALDGSVVPPNSGFFDANGAAVPPTRHITWPWKPLHPPVQPEFGDIAVWQRLLNARGTFKFEIAVWGPGAVTPEMLEDEVPPK